MANDSKHTQLGWTSTVEPELAAEPRIQAAQIPAQNERASQVVFYGSVDPIEAPRPYSPVRALIERAIVEPEYGPPRRSQQVEAAIEEAAPHARLTIRATLVPDVLVPHEVDAAMTSTDRQSDSAWSDRRAVASGAPDRRAASVDVGPGVTERSSGAASMDRRALDGVGSIDRAAGSSIDHRAVARAARAKSVGEYAVHTRKGGTPRRDVPERPVARHERADLVPAPDDDAALTTPTARAVTRDQARARSRSDAGRARSPSVVEAANTGRRAEVILPGAGPSSAEVRAHARASGVSVATPVPQMRERPQSAPPVIEARVEPIAAQPPARQRRRRADVMFPVPEDLGQPVASPAKGAARPTDLGYGSLSEAYGKPANEPSASEPLRAPTFLGVDTTPEILALMESHKAAHRSVEPARNETGSGNHGAWIHQHEPSASGAAQSASDELLAAMREGHNTAFLIAPTENEAPSYTALAEARARAAERANASMSPAGSPNGDAPPAQQVSTAADQAALATAAIGSTEPAATPMGHGHPGSSANHGCAMPMMDYGQVPSANGYASVQSHQAFAMPGGPSANHDGSHRPGSAPVPSTGSQAAFATPMMDGYGLVPPVNHGYGSVRSSVSVPSTKSQAAFGYGANQHHGSVQPYGPGAAPVPTGRAFATSNAPEAEAFVGSHGQASATRPGRPSAMPAAPWPYATPPSDEYRGGPVPMADYGYGPVPSSRGGYPGYVHVPQQGYVPSPLFSPHPAIPSMPSGRLARGSTPEMSRPIANADATANAKLERVRFIRRTYAHLFLAIVAFGALTWLLRANELLSETIAAPLTELALSGGWSWAIVLGAFVLISWIADCWARHAKSRAIQYAGLGFYVIAEALIFVPLLAVAEEAGAMYVVRDAATATLAIFGTLTGAVYVMRRDFSFLGGALAVASGGAFALIAISLRHGFDLGIVFAGVMVMLAGGYILCVTSRLLARHDPRHHVSAALALFASIALMFWYVIRLLLRR